MRILIQLAVLLLSTQAVLAQFVEAPPEHPNILFLFSDDQRSDTIGAWGNAHIRTPNIDSIVERGYSFRRNYCMGSMHGAVCVPSRAMLMSGRSLYRAPVDLDGVRTMPEALRGAGYQTFATGKWHNGRPAFARSFELGRNVMFQGMANHEHVPLVDVTSGEFSAQRTGEDFSSTLFADAAEAFLTGGRDPDRPFFAYVAFSTPHDPRQSPPGYAEGYYDHRPPLPANFMPQHPFNNGWMTGRDETLAPWPRTPAMISEQVCEYYAMITHMDEQIGRLLAALEREGLTDSTIVVFASDHGLALGSHGLLGKQSLYEHSMGCPLIIAGPGVPRGETRALTYLFDLYPTLGSLTGLGAADMDPAIEGRDLAPIWLGDRDGVRDEVFLAYEDLMRAIVLERYKLVRYPHVAFTQLFDLRADPFELTNLAGNDEQRARVADLTERLERLQAEYADKAPLTVDPPEPLEIDLTGRERKPDSFQPQWIVQKYFKNGG